MWPSLHLQEQWRLEHVHARQQWLAGSGPFAGRGRPHRPLGKTEEEDGAATADPLAWMQQALQQAMLYRAEPGGEAAQSDLNSLVPPTVVGQQHQPQSGVATDDAGAAWLRWHYNEGGGNGKGKSRRRSRSPARSSSSSRDARLLHALAETEICTVPRVFP